MNHLPQAWGRPRDDIYGHYNSSFLPQSYAGSQQPITHTQQPIVTGTSVLAVRYSTGVVIAADNLASYGSLARFTDVHRLKPFNSRAVVGFGGDVSDMQYLDRLLGSLDVEENYNAGSDEGKEGGGKPLMSARNLHTYLSKVMYKRRSDFNPLWNALLVCGLDDEGAPFLASADLLGTTFSAPTLATGFGAHLAQPILRTVVPDEEASKQLSKEKAVEAVKECMKVLFYRDARSMNEYSICVVDQAGVELKEDEKLENQSWAFADRIKGYGTQTV
ncbi:Proteasome subunit beta type-7 [Vermiconidia calcicola]|uniref:Proteasome subunit beta type-7 n=1 Tax=Vermiconidia calcicola TaxID=1690605 RepID=A0ACC3NLJ2_9PEZI|nr:Proteasome subunit beta type-7 [Vermiconidia calcicola]